MRLVRYTTWYIVLSPGMKKNSLSDFDVTARQQQTLNYILNQETDDTGAPLSASNPAAARTEQTLYQPVLTRDRTRVLLVSRDEGLLGGGVTSIEGYRHLGEVFDEVHIVLMRTGRRPVRFPVLRMSSNVWVYVASAEVWWQTPQAALATIDSHLAFAGGFRADMIIAHDPFECALVAAVASERYERPYQVHLSHNFYDSSFMTTDDHPRLRRWLAWFMLRHAKSIRTLSRHITAMVRRRFPAVPDVATLPRFNQYAAALTTPLVHNLKQQYPNFSVTILYVGSLNHNQLVHQVIDALSLIEPARNIGLVILGAGPAKAELEKKVKARGLEPNVVFESAVTKQADYIRSADLLIVTDTTSASDDLVLQAAASGCAILATTTTMRQDLFTDAQSIKFFRAGRGALWADTLRALVQNQAVCRSLAAQAQQVVSDQLLTDPVAFRYRYRSSIETVLFADEYVPPQFVPTAVTQS